MFLELIKTDTPCFSVHKFSLLYCYVNVHALHNKQPGPHKKHCQRVEFIVLTQILIKFQFQNLNQTSASRFKLKILTKPSFRILTKIQLQNLNQTSAAKWRPNFSFKICLNFNLKILTKPCVQSLNKRLVLWPNLSFQICNKLLPTQS